MVGFDFHAALHILLMRNPTSPQLDLDFPGTMGFCGSNDLPVGSPQATLLLRLSEADSSTGRGY